MWGNKNLPEFGCLSGVKVVHASQSVAGPFGPLLFAEYGADVLWLENALAPDISRSGASFGPEAERVNQRNLALNIPTPEGMEILSRILKDADVYVESTKGGQYAKWGLSDEALWKINPRLVIAHVSGFGQTGLPEYVGRPSYDAIAQAFSGYTYSNGNPTTAPYAVGPYTADYMTALFQAVAILAALHKVQKTGVGESIDIAQYELMMKVQNAQPDWFTEARPVNPAGKPSIMAGWGCYRCSDGEYVQLCLIGGGIVKKAVPFFGLEYGSDEIPAGTAIIFAETPGGKKFLDAVDAYLGSKTAAEAADEMRAAGLPATKVNTLEDLENDPHVQARDIIEEWESVKGAKVRSVGPVPRFKNNPGRIWRPAPFMGMDNEEVLAELGYSADEIASFYEKRVVTKDAEMKFTYPYKQFGR